jgi:lysophospholipase L1-like esterase
VALSLSSLATALIAAEIILRLAGFSFWLGPERVEFGYPDPITLLKDFARDPELLFVPVDYDVQIEDLRTTRPDLVFVGDSITYYGSYPYYFARSVARFHQAHVRWAKLGVPGWSSFQGLQQLRRDVTPPYPKVMTFFFGWNDHWIGMGFDDREIYELSSANPAWLDDLRLAQLVLKARVALRMRANRPLRVAPDDFRRNLQEMARISQVRGVIPVFLTAPTSHERGAEPEFLGLRWLSDVDRLVPLHQEYAAIVREVALEESAVLCDLARDFEALPRAALRKTYFFEDGIHLREPGQRKIAELLQDCFERDDRLAQVLIQLPSAGLDDEQLASARLEDEQLASYTGRYQIEETGERVDFYAEDGYLVGRGEKQEVRLFYHGGQEFRRGTHVQVRFELANGRAVGFTASVQGEISTGRRVP